MTWLSPSLVPLAAAALFALAVAGVAAYVRRRRRVARAVGDAALLRQLLGQDLGATP